jgi:cell division protein FtsZ
MVKKMDRRDFTKGLIGMGAMICAGSSAITGVRYLANLIEKDEALPVIKLVGVGSAGCRAVKGFLGKRFDTSNCLLISREMSDLEQVECQNWIFLREIERLSPFESCRDDGLISFIDQVVQSYETAIITTLRGADLIFIMAGMGWITGTMVAPLTAKICRNLKAPIAAAVTTPFSWEGTRPLENAPFGLIEIRKYTDMLTTHSLNQLLLARQRKTTIRVAFDLGVNLMQQTVLSLADTFQRCAPESIKKDT